MINTSGISGMEGQGRVSNGVVSSQGMHQSAGQNFRVVIRIRPPLPRERVQGCQFRSIVQVGSKNKSCSIMEYLGAEVTEKERQRDMDQNQHLCVWQSFTFDYVYDENSTQEFVYENTAR
jgi:kinesin family protein 3/17